MKSNANYTEIVIGKPQLMVLRAMVGDAWEVPIGTHILRCAVDFKQSTNQLLTWKDWEFNVRLDSNVFGPRVVTLYDGLKIVRGSDVHICLKSGTDKLLREREEFDIQNANLI
jgi:hypothetical protein